MACSTQAKKQYFHHSNDAKSKLLENCIIKQENYKLLAPTAINYIVSALNIYKTDINEQNFVFTKYYEMMRN